MRIKRLLWYGYGVYCAGGCRMSNDLVALSNRTAAIQLAFARRFSADPLTLYRLPCDVCAEPEDFCR